MVFYQKYCLSKGLHLDTGIGRKKSSNWAEHFVGGTHRCISEVVWSVLKNLASFSFYEKNTKKFSEDPHFWHEKPYKSGWSDRKSKRPKLPLESRSNHLWWESQLDRTKLKGGCPCHKGMLSVVFSSHLISLCDLIITFFVEWVLWVQLI